MITLPGVLAKILIFEESTCIDTLSASYKGMPIPLIVVMLINIGAYDDSLLLLFPYIIDCQYRI